MSQALNIQKKQIRAEIKTKLGSLGFFDLISRSDGLTAQFLRFKSANLGVFRNRFVVSFYPFETEPQINIESELRDEPYRVAYVRIEDWKSGVLSAREARRDLPGQWEDFELSAGNRVFQPVPEQPTCNPEELSVILVPGLAFTREGERLGRGAGFYDRFLASHPQALRVGVAFGDQLLDSLPTESWDERVDVVLTDRGTFETKLYGEWQKHGKIMSRSKT